MDGAWVPWDIVTSNEMFRLAVTVLSAFSRVEEYRDHVKYRFSAAAVAISFLKSLSPRTRCNVRKLYLLEDFDSVARPECHGRGFILFC